MDLKEQILKLEEKLFKVQEKKKKILEEEKELQEKLKVVRNKKEEEDNRNLVAMVEEQIGEMSESKLQVLKNFLAQHAGEFVEKEKNSPEEETRTEEKFAETDLAETKNFSEGRQPSTENNLETFGESKAERSGYRWPGIGDS